MWPVLEPHSTVMNLWSASPGKKKGDPHAFARTDLYRQKKANHPLGTSDPELSRVNSLNGFIRSKCSYFLSIDRKLFLECHKTVKNREKNALTLNYSTFS